MLEKREDLRSVTFASRWVLCPCRATRQASAQGGVHGAIKPSAMGWAPFQLGLRVHQATKQEGTNLSRDI